MQSCSSGRARRGRILDADRERVRRRHIAEPSRSGGETAAALRSSEDKDTSLTAEPYCIYGVVGRLLRANERARLCHGSRWKAAAFPIEIEEKERTRHAVPGIWGSLARVSSSPARDLTNRYWSGRLHRSRQRMPRCAPALGIARSCCSGSLGGASPATLEFLLLALVRTGAPAAAAPSHLL